MSTGQYDEVVKITWDVKDAEDAISRLIAKVDQLDTKAGTAGLAAGRRFSEGFRSGLQGAFNAVDELSARLDAVLSRQRTASSAPPPPAPQAYYNEYGEQVSQKPVYRYNAADAAFRLGPRDYYGQRYDEYGQPRFPNPIMGGSGIFEPGTDRWRNERGVFFRPEDFRSVIPTFSGPGITYGLGGGPPPIGSYGWPMGGFALGGFLGPGGVAGMLPPPGGIPIGGGWTVHGTGTSYGGWGGMGGGPPGTIPGSWAAGSSWAGPLGPAPTARFFDDPGTTSRVNQSQFMRHAGWIAQTIVIGTAFATAAKAAHDFGEELVRLDSVSQRLNFINGTTREGTVAQFLSAAEMGITPEQAAPGLITAAQYGLAGRDVSRAQQLAAVFGPEQFNNILTEIYQTEQRANAAGVEHLNIMSYIATAYQTGSGTLEDYFDSLQMGVELTQALGLSAEQAGLAVLKVSQGLEGTPSDAASLLQIIRRRISTQATVREGLAAEGITGPDMPSYFRQISEMAATGDPAQFERVLQLIVGGQNVTTRLANMRTALVELYEVMGAPPDMSSWQQLFAGFSDTTQFKINQLTASWKEFLLAVGDSFPGQIGVSMVNDRLGSTAEGLRSAGVILGGIPELMFSGASTRFAYANQLRSGIQNQFSERGVPTALADIILNQGFWYGVIADAINDTLGANARQPDTGRQGTVVTMPNGGRITSFGPPLPVEGFANLPQGVDFMTFYRTALEIQKTLSAIPGYQPNLETTAVLDRGRRLGDDDDRYRVIRLDAKAIQDAIDKVAKEIETTGRRRVRQVKPDFMDTFGGFDTFPEGLDWNAFVSGVRDNEQKLRTQVPGYKLDQKQIAFWDESGEFYRMLTADSEAIRRELAEQTKLMNQQITGVFNVPTGGEALVAFAALQAGFVPSDRLNGQSGGAAGPGRGSPGANNALLPTDYRRITGAGRPGPGNLLGDDDLPEDARRVNQTKATPNARPVAQPKPVGAVQVNNAITIRNQVILNGRIIVNQLLREFQRELRSAAQVSGAGGRVNLGV